MDPLNNPTPNPTPNPNPVPEPPKPESAMPPMEPASPVAPNPVTPPAPTNPIINPAGTAPASPAESIGGLGIAATDPIMMAEPPKVPDPVEQELNAPMKAAEPVPGSIGSAVSGPAGGVPNPVQNVAFNDPAVEANPNPNMTPAPGLELNSVPSGKGGLAKLFQEKKTMMILVVAAAAVAVILLIVLIIMMVSGGDSSSTPVSDDASSQNADNSDDNEGLNGTVVCTMTSSVLDGVVENMGEGAVTTSSETDKFTINIEEGEISSIVTYTTTIDESGNPTVNTSTEPYSADFMDFSIMQNLPFDEDGIVIVDSLDEFATSFQESFGQVLGEVVEVACEVE